MRLPRPFLPRPSVPQDTAGRVAAVLAVLGVVLVLAGLLLPSDDDAPATAAPAAVAVPADGPPDALVVPSIDLDAPLVPIEVDPAGVLTPPADTARVGWWRRSAQPGAARGQTLLTGHAVRSGEGVMDRLAEVEPGDLVQVRDGGRRVDYRATRVVTLTKAQVAAQATSLFGQDRPGGRLVLVSCTDWVDGDYRANVVVLADPVRAAGEAA